MNRKFADEWAERCKQIQKLSEIPLEVIEPCPTVPDEENVPKFDIFKRALPSYKNVPIMFGLTLEQATKQVGILNEKEVRERNAMQYDKVVFYDIVPQDKPEEKSLFFNQRPVILEEAA